VKPDSLLQRSIAAHQQGRLKEAEAGYLSLLRRSPRDANVLNFLGMLRFHQRNPGEAVQLLRRSIEANPANPHARINLGNVLLETGELEGARECFTKATELAPENALAWNNLGVCLRRLQRFEEAADCLLRALKLNPGQSKTYEALGKLLYRLGKVERARELYEEWVRQEPSNPVARHMLAAMSGDQAPARADDEYVAKYFDTFADNFDENLAELGYQAPSLLCERVARVLGSQACVDILDAGCGTGLCGPLLRPLARTLAGVDLSPGMVEKARAREVYDELIVQELSAFMRSRPGAFDVVVSADTLVYFGALEEPLVAARECLRPGGWLLFSLERLDPDETDYRLQPHGRYSHGETYVRQVVQAHGFVLSSLETHSLRRELGQDVSGHVVTAQRVG
jgi:predicted TPR repeat methyltransferase